MRMEPYACPPWGEPPPPSCARAQIEAIKDGSVAETLSVGRAAAYTLGRAEENDFILLHATASRRHCSLVWGKPLGASAEFGLHALDLGSTHGTFVGRGASRKRLEAHVPHRMRHGEALTFGESTRVYVALGLPDDPPPTRGAEAADQDEDASSAVSWGMHDDVEGGGVEGEEEDGPAVKPAGGRASSSSSSSSTSGRKRKRPAGGHYLDDLREEEGLLVGGEEGDGAGVFEGGGDAVLSRLGGGGQSMLGRGASSAAQSAAAGPYAWLDKLDAVALNEKEVASLDKVRAKLLRVKAITTECERIRAKEGGQGGLTDGQAATLARNEGLLSDLEAEVDDQATTLRDRLEGRRPGCTGLPSSGTAQSSKGVAMGYDKVIEEDVDSKMIDRTAGRPAARTAVPRFTLTKPRPGGSGGHTTTPATTMVAAPSMPLAPVGRLETEASLASSLSKVQAEMRGVLAEQCLRDVPHTSALLPSLEADDELEAYVRRTEAAGQEADAVRRNARLEGLAAEESRLSKLLDIVRPSFHALSSTSSRGLDVPAASNAHQLEEAQEHTTQNGRLGGHPIAAAPAALDPDVRVQPAGSTSAERPPVGVMLPPPRPAHDLVAPGGSAPLGKGAPQPPAQPREVGSAHGGLSGLLASRIMDAKQEGRAGEAPPVAHRPQGKPVPPKPKYDSDDVVDVSRLL